MRLSSLALGLVLIATSFVVAQVATPLLPKSGGPSADAIAPAVGSVTVLPDGVPSFKPGPRERMIVRNYVSILESQHLSHRPIDVEVSRRAFDLYFKSLDSRKLYFLQSDVDAYNKYRDTFAALAKGATEETLSVPFDIYNLYLQRFVERMKTVQQILREPIDLTVDEDYVIDYKTLPYPSDVAEANARWRKQIKIELLALKAESREKKKKNDAKESDGTSTPNSATSSSSDEDPIVRLQRRYASLQNRMLRVSASSVDDIVETYLNSICNAYDPHTSYMSPTTQSSFDTQINLRLEGIGATLQGIDGYTVVKKLVPGGPADKSGELKPEDKIIGVGQGDAGPIEDVVDWKLGDVVQKIRGQRGTTVRLEVLANDGSGKKIVRIVRDKIELKDEAAKSAIFDCGTKEDGTPYRVGVINLPSFYLDMEALRRGDPNPKSTVTDIKKILDDFVKDGVDLVVLDLQFNGGGSLHEAIALTGLFIETGCVVQTKDLESPAGDAKTDRDPSVAWTGPLVVLINKFSASASEIFAGAIQDYGRGLIIGDSRTHGKGSVQQIKDLAEMLQLPQNYGAIKLTIQGFYRPSGESPQKKGVRSDVVLPSFFDVLEDVTEEDLDYALDFPNIGTAKSFPKYNYVPAEMLPELRAKSEARVAKSEEFAAVKKDIQSYNEIKSRKTRTLNEEKYFAEIERLNADKKQKERLDSLIDKDAGIVRDDYLNEAMQIGIDAIRALHAIGIDYPKERQVAAPKSSGFFNILGGGKKN
ncbi:MAG: carboxy terminal-processing peptidase [Thermoguttaceae bacterium]